MKYTNCGTASVNATAAERRDASIGYLSQVKDLHEKIDLKLAKIDTRRDSLSLHSPMLSDMPKNPSPPASAMEENLIEILTLEQDVEQLRRGEPELKARMMGVTGRVDDVNEQRVLIGFFLNLKSCAEIGIEINYAESYVGKLRRRGIDKVAVILEEEGVLGQWIARQRHWM